MRDFGIFLLATAGYGCSIAALAIAAMSFWAFFQEIREKNEDAMYNVFGAFLMLGISFTSTLVTTVLVTT